MVNKSSSFIFLLVCAVMWSFYEDYNSSAVGHMYAMWIAYLFRAI